MRNLDRITIDSNVMGEKPCIRGLRVTVGTLVGLLASDHSIERILIAYPLFGRGRFASGFGLYRLARRGSRHSFGIGMTYQ